MNFFNSLSLTSRNQVSHRETGLTNKTSKLKFSASLKAELLPRKVLRKNDLMSDLDLLKQNKMFTDFDLLNVIQWENKLKC